MATLVGTQETAEKLVEALLNLEHDAIEAYDAVIERLENTAMAEQVAEFRQDHHRHVQELSKIAGGMNIEITDGSPKAMLTKGKVVLADMIGDEAVLRAMKTNEDDTVTAYERASKQECCTEALRDTCERAHQDELRHRRWMEQMAEKMDRAA